MERIRRRLAVAADRRTLTRALITSLVGVVLTFINHGDVVLGGQLRDDRFWPIALTFPVPFIVTLVSTVAAVQDKEVRRQDLDSAPKRGTFPQGERPGDPPD